MVFVQCCGNRNLLLWTQFLLNEKTLLLFRFWFFFLFDMCPFWYRRRRWSFPFGAIIQKISDKKCEKIYLTNLGNRKGGLCKTGYHRFIISPKPKTFANNQVLCGEENHLFEGSFQNPKLWIKSKLYYFRYTSYILECLNQDRTLIFTKKLII